MSGSHLTKDFFELVKAIGESKSKQEEDQIIVHEVATLKKRMNDPPTNPVNKKRMKEFLIRLMYVEMLGHDASFGYIKAVELTASSNLMQKRVGYLCCTLVLSPEHEFRFMIINQLQRDLQSSNHLEVCSALMAIAKLVTVEMIPAVQPMIADLLRHDMDVVRKKAVMALHRFHQLNPEAITGLSNDVRRTLCDRDPSVMGASLNLLHDLALKSPPDYKDLVPSFVSILKQITEHRLPREFDYHRIPAPWIQIRLLQILAVLGQADQQTSEGMYEVLHDVMRRADTGINVGYAIIYECVRTVTSIYPNNTLLDAAAASISRFISSDNHNLKYLGVTGLASIVKDHPRYATAHQMAVVDCLEDPDETLKRKTLDLLYRMTNPVNVEFICEKLTQFLKDTTDEFLREELVSRVTQCAERYAPSNFWYIHTMTLVFELGGDLVRSEIAHNLLRLISEGSGEDEDKDMELRHDAVETYLELLDRPTLPDILVRVISWILGEYGYLSSTMSLDEICERLCELAERPFNEEDVTRGYVLTAVAKLVAQLGNPTVSAQNLFQKYSESRSTDLQQRCFEYMALLQHIPLMIQVLPVDASCEDIDVDENMDFLSGFVEQAAAQGASKYNPPDDSDDEGGSSRRRSGGDLKFQAYEKPEIPHATSSLPPQQMNTNIPTAPKDRWGPNVTPRRDSIEANSDAYNNQQRNVKNVWGPSGFNAGNKPPENYPSNAPVSSLQYPPTQGYGNDSYPPQQPQQPQQQQQPSAYGGYNPNTNPVDGGEEEEDDDQEMDEKRKMASALFGGLPGASSNAERKPRRSSKGLGTASRGTTVVTGANRFNNRPNNGPRKPSLQEAPSISNHPSTSMPPPRPTMEANLLDIAFDVPTKPAPPLPPSNLISNSSISRDPFGLDSLSQALPGNGISFELDGKRLNPWKISTSEFGSAWGICEIETKARVSNSSIRSLDDLMSRAGSINLHPVEAILKTNEAIAAGCLTQSNINCLVHTKIRSGGFLDITVRTSDQRFSDMLIGFLEKALQ